jgi:hypothetical protein
MAREIYTAEATVTGGRAQGHGVTSDHNLDVQLRPPAEMGGDSSGTNPEQLFAVGSAMPPASKARSGWSLGASTSRPATSQLTAASA